MRTALLAATMATLAGAPAMAQTPATSPWALSLGLTITAFVRLAIELYLSRLVMEKHSQYVVTDTDLTWEGVRITEYIQIFATNAGSRPFYRHLSCEYFPVDSYW